MFNAKKEKKEIQSHLKKSFDHTFRNRERDDISTNRDSATLALRHFDDIAKRNANSIKQSFRDFKKRKFFAIDSIRFHFDEFWFQWHHQQIFDFFNDSQQKSTFAKFKKKNYLFSLFRRKTNMSFVLNTQLFEISFQTTQKSINIFAFFKKKNHERNWNRNHNHNSNSNEIVFRLIKSMITFSKIFNNDNIIDIINFAIQHSTYETKSHDFVVDKQTNHKLRHRDNIKIVT